MLFLFAMLKYIDMYINDLFGDQFSISPFLLRIVVQVSGEEQFQIVNNAMLPTVLCVFMIWTLIYPYDNGYHIS